MLYWCTRLILQADVLHVCYVHLYTCIQRQVPYLCIFKQAEVNWSTYLNKHGISIVSDVFEGQLQSSMKCGECQQVLICQFKETTKMYVLMHFHCFSLFSSLIRLCSYHYLFQMER